MGGVDLMIKVRQTGFQTNRSFIVKDKKKIDFWKMVESQGHALVRTEVKDL